MSIKLASDGDKIKAIHNFSGAQVFVEITRRQVFVLQDKAITKTAIELESSDMEQDFELYKKLINGLGFHGIILEADGDSILAVTAIENLKPGTQAVVITNSAGRLKFSSRIEDADALLQVVESKGKYALFQILLRQNNKGELIPGSKLKFGTL